MSFQNIHSDTHTTFDIGSAPNEAFRGGENGALSAPSLPGNGGWDVEGEKKMFCEDMPFLGGGGASTGGGGVPKPIGRGTKPAKKPLSAFLQKLRDIVDKSGSLCEWSASGDSLVVTDSSTFAVETLPQYFRYGTHPFPRPPPCTSVVSLVHNIHTEVCPLSERMAHRPCTA